MLLRRRFHEILLQQCEEHMLPSLAALTVFKHLADAALPRNEGAYLHVLRVLCNNGQPPGVIDDLHVAVKVLRKMEDEGMDPSAAEYGEVVSGFGRHGELESALETADHAVYAGVTPALEVFEGLLEACAQAGDQRVASELFKLMQAAEPPLPASAACFQGLLRAAIAAGDARFASRVWRNMLTEGHAGDNVLELCAEVFGVIGKAGPSAAPLVDKTFDTLEPNFVGPDDTTYTAVVTACVRCGDVGAATRYLVKMVEAASDPSPALLEQVLEGCVEPGAADAAGFCFELWLELRRRAGLHASTAPPEPFDYAMQAAVRAGDTEMVSEVLAGPQPTTHL